MRRVPSAPIDLRSVRPLRGTQHGGFEELCVSLFRHEMGYPRSLLRIDGAGGDGGVEAYFLEKPTSTFGLQAKFSNICAPASGLKYGTRSDAGGKPILRSRVTTRQRPLISTRTLKRFGDGCSSQRPECGPR